MKIRVRWNVIALFLSLSLTGWFAGWQGLTWLVFGLVTVGLLSIWGQWVKKYASVLYLGDGSPFTPLLSLFCLVIGLIVYVCFSIWLFHPELLPQRTYYDIIANRQVTERLVDPALLKVEKWDIMGKERQVLFVHPAPSGSTSLVYPVKVEPKTTFRTLLAMAPEAWTTEGDGVTFSIYVEDKAGFHLLYSQYVDPKHQQQDRRWIPIQIPLCIYRGKIVRLILAVNSGPAGDLRYDWAGWGEPRLEKPVWP